MNIKWLCDKIYLVEFYNQYEMCSTLMRPQEFYESPFQNIRNRYFTHEEFMDTYAKHNNGKFTYFTDWSGFNLPGIILVSFFDRFPEKDLSRKEEFLRYILKNIIKSLDSKFYLIGAIKGDTETIDHELAHAFYYLDKEYKKDMDWITNEWCERNLFKQTLLEHGYDESVIMDEIQAYMTTSTQEYLDEKLNFHKSIPEKYKQIFDNKKNNVDN